MFEAHFQSFEDRGERGASAPRVAALRAELARRGLDGFIVPRADRYQNEYVPPCAERLAWLTGFTGSAGVAIVLADRAAIFVDGRYQVQVREEVDSGDLHRRASGRASAGGVDRRESAGRRQARLFAVAAHGRRRRAARQSLRGRRRQPRCRSTTIRSTPSGPTGRTPPLGAVVLHDLRYAGEDGRSKARARPRRDRKSSPPTRWWCPIRTRCRWLFNIRGSDVPHTPVVLAFAMVPKDGPAGALCRRPQARQRCPAARSKKSPRCRRAEDFERDLAALGKAQRAVRLDPAACPEAIARLVADNGGKVLRGSDPIAPMKAVKNAAEIAGARAAQQRDGVAVTRFLAWFDREAPRGNLTEIDAVEALESFRRDTGLLKDVSFPTIAGAGPDGAIVHYRVTRKSNRRIAPGELFLINSGGQYEDGTTDITRTVAVGTPSADMRRNFTLVLKGHIAIARAVFPDGTTGAQLDTSGAAISVAGRARFRSRHRPRRRQLSLGA